MAKAIYKAVYYEEVSSSTFGEFFSLKIEMTQNARMLKVGHKVGQSAVEHGNFLNFVRFNRY